MNPLKCLTGLWVRVGDQHTALQSYQVRSKLLKLSLRTVFRGQGFRCCLKRNIYLKIKFHSESWTWLNEMAAKAELSESKAKDSSLTSLFHCQTAVSKPGSSLCCWGNVFVLVSGNLWEIMLSGLHQLCKEKSYVICRLGSVTFLQALAQYWRLFVWYLVLCTHNKS